MFYLNKAGIFTEAASCKAIKFQGHRITSLIRICQTSVASMFELAVELLLPSKRQTLVVKVIIRKAKLKKTAYVDVSLPLKSGHLHCGRDNMEKVGPTKAKEPPP